MSVAIKVENLSKRYMIGSTAQERHDTLRDALAAAAARCIRPFRRARPDERSRGVATEEFWALRDVSFEVKKGDRLGIVGRNGAGKSTLLKILSRITEPTRGRVELSGRVASLLEVGTGFHPELTGRENIFLNGAVLGMTRAEIRRKFDDIVAFADVARFLDTPVKRYSSGMYVRLAFAIAAFMEPEILIVDEVLAVGDAEFQSRCLGKLQSVSETEGRTVLIVSHNMAAINRLSNRAVLLEGGRLIKSGTPEEITTAYMAHASSAKAIRVWEEDEAPGDEVARLLSIKVMQSDEPCESVDIALPVTIAMEYLNCRDGAHLLSCASLFDDLGTPLFVTAQFDQDEWAGPRGRGRYRSTCTVPGNIFAEGWVHVAAEIATRYPTYAPHVLHVDAISFQVVDRGTEGGVRGPWTRRIPGVLRPRCSWKTERCD